MIWAMTLGRKQCKMIMLVCFLTQIKKKTVSDFLLELFLLMHVSFRFLRNNLAWVGLGNKDSWDNLFRNTTPEGLMRKHFTRVWSREQAYLLVNILISINKKSKYCFNRCVTEKRRSYHAFSWRSSGTSRQRSSP